MSVFRVHLSSAGTLLMILLSFCNATENQLIEKVLSSDTNCSKEIPTVCCPFGRSPNSSSFKVQRGSDLCTQCPAGHYLASIAAQVNCTQCPAKYYCKAGAAKALLCESFYVCPLGTDTPMEVFPSWRMESDGGFHISTALIIVICVIIVPVVLTVIILIIYKLYKYCRRRRYAELYPGETEPLFPGSRLLQEPVYTGL